MRLILEVQEDTETGDHYLQFSDEMLAELGWQIGDPLEWIDNQDGSWTIRKTIS
jgi:hypothetical protein